MTLEISLVILVGPLHSEGYHCVWDNSKRDMFGYNSPKINLLKKKEKKKEKREREREREREK
jgi:hypothetical protein